MNYDISIYNIVQFDHRKASCQKLKEYDKDDVTKAIALFFNIREHVNKIHIYKLNSRFDEMIPIRNFDDVSDAEHIGFVDLFSLGQSSLSLDYIQTTEICSSVHEGLKLFSSVIKCLEKPCSQLSQMTENCLNNTYIVDNIKNYLKNNESITSHLIPNETEEMVIKQDNFIQFSNYMTYQLCKILSEETELYKTDKAKVLKWGEVKTIPISGEVVVEIHSDLFDYINSVNPEQGKTITQPPPIEDIGELVDLGGGAFGKVYKFTPKKHLDVHVVIKRNKDLEAKRKKPSWYREVDHTKTLCHANIIKYFGDPVFYNKYVYNVMEYGGKCLEVTYFKKQHMELNQIYNAMFDVASGMSYLHENLVIHRDIRSPNITFQEEEGMYKIIDFGMSSKTTLDNSKFFSEIKTWGNSFWLCPEILLLHEKSIKEGDGVNKSSDIWMFGVFVLEMLSFPKRPAHISKYQTGHAYRVKLINRKDSPMNYWKKNWPDDIKELLNKCFSFQPEERIDSEELVCECRPRSQ